MKVIWLGQAGLYLESAAVRVMIDPYLSDSVYEASDDPALHRRVPVPAWVWELIPDVLIFTHDHLDHYDPETAHRFFASAKKPLTVLSPPSVWERVRKSGYAHNYVRLRPYTEWSVGDLRIIAHPAEHSDPDAIGVIITEQSTGKVCYITGDTLYNSTVIDALTAHHPEIDAVFLPVNGVGNNMNMTDAARFAHAIGAKYAVPLHWGLFDGLNGADFPFESKIVPEFFREIKLP